MTTLLMNFIAFIFLLLIYFYFIFG